MKKKTIFYGVCLSLHKKLLFIMICCVIEVILLYIWLTCNGLIALSVYPFSFISLIVLSSQFKKDSSLSKSVIAVILLSFFLTMQEIFSKIQGQLYYSDYGYNALKYFYTFYSTFLPYCVYVIFHFLKFLKERRKTGDKTGRKTGDGLREP